MEEQQQQRVVLALGDLCRFCLSNKCDQFSLIPLSERHAKQFKDLTKRELPLSDHYPQNACLQCCNDLENTYSFKNLLLQRQDELDELIISTLQSVSAPEEYEDDIIEEYLEAEQEDDEEEEEDETEEAQDLRTKFNEMPSVKNLSQTPNKNDIVKLIDDIEKNNQLIYENSKPTILWKKRKPRTVKPKPPLLMLPPTPTQTNDTQMMRNEPPPLLLLPPEPKLIFKPYVETSDERYIMPAAAAGEEKEKRECVRETERVFQEHKYACTIDDCSESFPSEFLLKQHTQTHPKMPVVCCDQFFVSFPDYKRHNRIVHADAIMCTSCGKVLKSPKTFRIHLKSHLKSSDRQYKCERKGCNKAFNMKTHLENHQRIHSNQRPFACPLPQCPTAFRQKHQVRLHLRNKHNCAEQRD